MKVLKVGHSREDLHRMVAAADTKESREAHAEWMKTRPQAVKDVEKQVDMWKVLRIKPNAPYRMTCEGTVGIVLGFTERANGGADVIFIAHEIHYDEKQHDAFELRKLEELKGPLRVNVDPEWLEPDPIPNEVADVKPKRKKKAG